MTGSRSEVLGVADVDDATLREMVAAALGDEVEGILTCEASTVNYDLDTLTTAGRYWVRGTAATRAGTRPFAFFVKVVQSWGRNPAFAFVPPEFRAMALEGLPWRAEPIAYRSGLADLLPAGLRMPRAFRVEDIDDESAAIWMEAVDVAPVAWDEPRFREAARLLGRLAADPRLQELELRAPDPSAHRGYASGRLTHQLMPALRSDVWHHPLVAASFDDDLRSRLLIALDRLPEYLDELDRVPSGTAHGDACTRNLLVTRGEPAGFTLIDFGFWGPAHVGFDLGQLLIGEVQTGERPADDLRRLHAACLPAYVDGLHDAGLDVDPDVVARAHALQLLEFYAFSSIPLESLGAEITPELVATARERAAAARFTLDLVDTTTPLAA